jgi:hypothetical protein
VICESDHSPVAATIVTTVSPDFTQGNVSTAAIHNKCANGTTLTLPDPILVHDGEELMARQGATAVALALGPGVGALVGCRSGQRGPAAYLDPVCAGVPERREARQRQHRTSCFARTARAVVRSAGSNQANGESLRVLHPKEKHMQQTSAIIDPLDTTVVTAELVAKTIAGISTIGHARSVLERAGWRATIAANRITVGEEIIAQLIPAKTGTYGPITEHWIVHSLDGTPPVWIVGSDVRS